MGHMNLICKVGVKTSVSIQAFSRDNFGQCTGRNLNIECIKLFGCSSVHVEKIIRAKIDRTSQKVIFWDLQTM